MSRQGHEAIQREAVGQESRATTSGWPRKRDGRRTKGPAGRLRRKGRKGCWREKGASRSLAQKGARRLLLRKGTWMFVV
eukprot:349822-Chlamydomonas_euryale.AAC.4